VVLHRELVGLAFTGGYQQVQRFLKPTARNGSGRSWRRCGPRPCPGEQAKSITASSGCGSASSRDGPLRDQLEPFSATSKLTVPKPADQTFSHPVG
jgi:hypothetical protein